MIAAGWIFARSPLFLAIAATVIVLLGFYGRTKDRTLLAMVAVVLGLVVIDGFVTHLNGSIMIVAVVVASAICFASRKR